VQPSPYTPGEAAKHVQGRNAQLADFEERLSYLVDLNRLVGRIRVDHAPRGYGKTSLLREYQRRAEERNVATIWITAGDRGGLLEQLASELVRASAGWSAAARRSVAVRLESLTVRVGAPGIASVEATVHPKAAVMPAGARELEDVVRAASAVSTGLVIFIDEVQSADSAGLRTLAYAWQHLQSEGSDVPAAVYTAGLPNSPDVIAAAVTFSERFEYRQLPGLTPDAEELALVQPARALGVAWEPEALTEALSVAQGYPYLLQLIGDASWAAAGRPDPGVVLTADDVARGALAMEEDMNALFRARWAVASAGERDLMAAMAALGDGTVSRRAVADRMGVSTNALSVPRARLIDKGFIQAGGRGNLEFTIPGFAQFIRDLGGGDDGE
jgi:hypothetical protein